MSPDRPSSHIAVLDGWRGISISLVLAAHLLPLGPKFLQMNVTVAAAGMAIFFFLSGFLIVSMLLKNCDVISFLIRRACRILPLAWLFILVVLAYHRAPGAAWAANVFFYANLPPFYLDFGTGHFWSLCVEVQFYCAIAVIVAVMGRRGLWAVPFLCVLVTALQIADHVTVSIVTWFRVNEILAGGCVAMALSSDGIRLILAKRTPFITPFLMAALLIASCHPMFGALGYARPYIAAVMIGSTIVRPQRNLLSVLASRPLAYLAEISYALYVFHPLMASGWLGSGSTLVKYAKRPLVFLLSFLFAHVSTRYYESRWIAFGHRLTSRRSVLREGLVASTTG